MKPTTFPGALTDIQRNRYLELCADVRKHGFMIAEALRSLKQEALYVEHYDTFEDFCKGEFGMGKSYAYRLIGAAETKDNLGAIAKSNSVGAYTEPTTPYQLQPLQELEPEAQAQVWEKATEVNDNPSRSEVLKAKRIVLASPEGPKEPTPAPRTGFEYPLTLSVWKAMGELDLEVGSNANNLCTECIEGEEAFDIPWKGCVFVHASRFVNYLDKILEDFEAGKLKQAILLVPYLPYDSYMDQAKAFPFHIISRKLKKDGADLGEKYVAYGIGVDFDTFNRAFVENNLSHGACLHAPLS